MMSRSALSVLSALALLAALAASAQAQILKDPQWQAWLDAEKSAELERAAQARLSAQPDDAQAAVALALAVLDGGDAGRLEAVAKPLQACVARQPSQAICHYALGVVQGVQATGAGMFKAMSLAGSSKDNLQRAVALEPQLYEARQALTQFYLMAPGVAGGSVAKAKEQAAAVEKGQPEQAKLLRALIAAQDKQWAEMERELHSIKTGDSRSLQNDLREAWAQLGAQLLNDKQLPKSKAVFEQLARDYPTRAIGAYGLGRVATEQGQPEEAIKQLERARTLDGADKLPIDHRLGIALLAKGDKAQARQVLERFVANKRANPRNLEDAKKRLAELG